MSDIVLATLGGSLSMGAVYLVLSWLHVRSQNRREADSLRRHVERFYTEVK